MATVTTIPADITNLKKEIDSIKSDVAKKLEISGGTITGDLTVVGGISGELSGNASTATKLKTARKINSVSFDGSKDINLTPENVGALPITGGALTGGLTAAGEIVSKSGNGFRIVQGNYGFFIRNDGSNTYFMLTNSGDSLGTWNSLRPLTINDASGGVTIGNGLTVNGSLGLGTANALGGNSIVLGDNDTGFKQNGDGLLDVYANSQHVFRFQNGTLQSNNPVNVAGQVTPSDYGNFDSRYVKDVRLGSQQYYGVNNWQTWNFQCPAGHVLSGINVQDTGSNSADNIAGVYYRPVQKYINGTWYNVASV